MQLDFLQYASGSRAGGIVTQFDVRVSDPSRLEAVANTIDSQFASAQEPTNTSAEKAFIASAASDIIAIVRFMGWLGWGCLAAVLALVGNAIVLSVQDRIREHAIFQTLGFQSHQIVRLIMAEGMLLSLCGAVLGCAAAMGFLRYSGLALTVESHSIPIKSSLWIFLQSVVVAASVGVLASLLPAWQAGRRDIVSCFRAT